MRQEEMACQFDMVRDKVVLPHASLSTMPWHRLYWWPAGQLPSCLWDDVTRRSIFDTRKLLRRPATQE
jgi:hypothetical protein